MGLSVEKNWLMDYGILRLVNRCRRLMEVEFGVKPALHDPALPDMLAHYAGSTRQKALQECYAELRLALLELEGPDAIMEEVVAEKPQRMYRGRPMAAEEAPRRPSAGSGSGKTVIYRGRVVQTD